MLHEQPLTMRMPAHAWLCSFTPKPFVARCEEDVIKARGVKPVLSPNLSVRASM